ncbi:Panacea domain-containing protein [Actinophytocola glycyrrhizae]|uniref:Panacea domain-containing protein n=1 Tax=Actinophytocola glycyrrhizae TaxID=2044873 RepID=A0ABV9S347_9PSEU
MSAEYNAMTIAKWFIAWAEEEEGADLSNLKLQKLLYYAQGHHLAATGTPLFGEEIQAWSHGPVVPAVYHEFKHYGSHDVTLEPDDPFVFDEVDEETAEFLSKVWNTYGGYAAWRLRNMTHDERPWKDHFSGHRSVVIPKSELQQYFKSVRR